MANYLSTRRTVMEQIDGIGEYVTRLTVDWQWVDDNEVIAATLEHRGQRIEFKNIDGNGLEALSALALTAAALLRTEAVA